MAQLDRARLCDIAEYQRALESRMKDDEFSDGEILMLLMRLVSRKDAVKAPAQVKTVRQEMGELIIDVLIVNEDLKPPKGATPAAGRVVDGIWNEIDPKDAIGIVDERGRGVRAFDGVFERYDDGIDMGLFEGELVGAGVASSGVDLGSLRI